MRALLVRLVVNTAVTAVRVLGALGLAALVCATPLALADTTAWWQSPPSGGGGGGIVNGGGDVANRVAVWSAANTLMGYAGLVHNPTFGLTTLSGLGWNVLDVNGGASFRLSTPAALAAGTTNDWSPGFPSFQRISAAGAATVTGMVAGTNGHWRTMCNVGANAITLAHNNAGSAAANRILSPTGAGVTLTTDQCATLAYDTVSARWRIESHAATPASGAFPTADGTAAAPAWSFAAGLGDGAYRNASGDLAFTANGVESASVTTTGLLMRPDDYSVSFPMTFGTNAPAIVMGNASGTGVSRLAIGFSAASSPSIFPGLAAVDAPGALALDMRDTAGNAFAKWTLTAAAGWGAVTMASPHNSGQCTLNGAATAQCTVVVSGVSVCVCVDADTTGGNINAMACYLSGGTLVVQSSLANDTSVVSYHCF